MISGLFTASALLAFLGIAAWAYSQRNRARFDEAARLPLEEPSEAAAPASRPCCKERS